MSIKQRLIKHKVCMYYVLGIHIMTIINCFFLPKYHILYLIGITINCNKVKGK